MEQEVRPGTRRILEVLQRELLCRPEILFAYVHGSFLTSDDARDLDLAVYLDPESFARLASRGSLHLDFSIPLEMDLEAVLGGKLDIQLLNRAPLSFRCRVACSGRIAIDRDTAVRCEFEYLSRCEYFDFRNRRRQYVLEASR